MRITELQIGSIQENDYLAADESTYGTRKILLSDVIAMAKAIKTSNYADNLLQREFECYGPRYILLTESR